MQNSEFIEPAPWLEPKKSNSRAGSALLQLFPGEEQNFSIPKFFKTLEISNKSHQYSGCQLLFNSGFSWGVTSGFCWLVRGMKSEFWARFVNKLDNYPLGKLGKAFLAQQLLLLLALSMDPSAFVFIFIFYITWFYFLATEINNLILQTWIPCLFSALIRRNRGL